MKREKTVSFEEITNILSDLTVATIQHNEVQQYARICFTDDFVRDNYKLFRDFAIYYNHVSTYEINIADTFISADDCKRFKANHNKLENKTSNLKFTVTADELRNTVYELIALKLLQTEKALQLNFTIKTTTATKKQSKRKAVNK